MGEMSNAYKISVRRHEGKRPLGRHRCRLDNDIKMDFKEIGYRMDSTGSR
jgi:hypothetical protein